VTCFNFACEPVCPS